MSSEGSGWKIQEYFVAAPGEGYGPSTHVSHDTTAPAYLSHSDIATTFFSFQVRGCPEDFPKGSRVSFRLKMPPLCMLGPEGGHNGGAWGKASPTGIVYPTAGSIAGVFSSCGRILSGPVLGISYDPDSIPERCDSPYRGSGVGLVLSLRAQQRNI